VDGAEVGAGDRREEEIAEGLQAIAGAGELGAEGVQAGAELGGGLAGDASEALGGDPGGPGAQVVRELGGGELEGPGAGVGEFGVAGDAIEVGAHEDQMGPRRRGREEGELVAEGGGEGREVGGEEVGEAEGEDDRVEGLAGADAVEREVGGARVLEEELAGGEEVEVRAGRGRGGGPALVRRVVLPWPGRPMHSQVLRWGGRCGGRG
jgi:hypothetical protein